jgi:plasmid stabilization system protein ParE
VREGSFYIRPEAEEDVAEAYLWYERQSPGLGEAFFEELGRLYDKINANPQLFQQIRGEIRRAAPSRFPFGVFYLIAADRIEVLAVLHQMRDPKRWRSRSTG